MCLDLAVGENMRGFLKKLTVDVDRKGVGIGLLDKELLHSWSPRRERERE